jgi:hypothetical protein
MRTPIPRRTGVILLAAGLIGLVFAFTREPPPRAIVSAALALATLAGALLLTGRHWAVNLVRALAVALVTGGLLAPIGWLALRPLDLTLTELRLDPGRFVDRVVDLAVILLSALWVARALGRGAVRRALADSGVTPWDGHVPAQAAIGLVVLATIVAWLPLHGPSAEVAAALAMRQLGPGYRYQLTAIRDSGDGRDAAVVGVVTAWNDKEIRTLILRWHGH